MNSWTAIRMEKIERAPGLRGPFLPVRGARAPGPAVIITPIGMELLLERANIDGCRIVTLGFCVGGTFHKFRFGLNRWRRDMHPQPGRHELTISALQQV